MMRQAMTQMDFVQELDRIFSCYWGGHHEVVTTFFSAPWSTEALVKWMDLQLYKEIHVVPKIARKLIEAYERLDDGVERGEFEHEAYELADEVQHYRLLADLRELITGECPPARSFEAIPEQLDLERVRDGGRGSPLTKAIVGFAPGGGTAFAAAGMLLEHGPVERQLAKIFKVIYEQELEHYRKNRVLFEKYPPTANPETFEETLQFARKYARQHFILRNASFSYPLDERRVSEIDRGLVRPFSVSL